MYGDIKNFCSRISDHIEKFRYTSESLNNYFQHNYIICNVTLWTTHAVRRGRRRFMFMISSQIFVLGLYKPVTLKVCVVSNEKKKGS